MFLVSPTLCMAINLYQECRSASDKECQLINRVVINRMHDTGRDACNVIFEKNQFSWTRNFPEKLQFNSYSEMLAYYKLKNSAQLIRAFNNVYTSEEDSKDIKISSKMRHYNDLSIGTPSWAKYMHVAFRTQKFVFYNA